MSLDLERIDHANNWVENNRGSEKLRPILRSAALDVRQCGLLQMSAYWLSKKDEHATILKGVLCWLSKAQKTKEICRDLDTNTESPSSVVAKLLEKHGELRLLDEEAELYLSWMARLFEGVHAAKERKKAREEREKAQRKKEEEDRKRMEEGGRQGDAQGEPSVDSDSVPVTEETKGN